MSAETAESCGSPALEHCVSRLATRMGIYRCGKKCLVMVYLEYS
jgi:hypothetical protein